MASGSVQTSRINLDELMGELNSVVNQLESPDITLEESVILYQRGLEIRGKISAALDDIETYFKELPETSKTK